MYSASEMYNYYNGCFRTVVLSLIFTTIFIKHVVVHEITCPELHQVIAYDHFYVVSVKRTLREIRSHFHEISATTKPLTTNHMSAIIHSAVRHPRGVVFTKHYINSLILRFLAT